MNEVGRVRVPSLVLAVGLLAAAVVVGIVLSWATGWGTDVHGRPCLTHLHHAEGCHAD